MWINWNINRCRFQTDLVPAEEELQARVLKLRAVELQPLLKLLTRKSFMLGSPLRKQPTERNITITMDLYMKNYNTRYYNTNMDMVNLLARKYLVSSVSVCHQKHYEISAHGDEIEEAVHTGLLHLKHVLFLQLGQSILSLSAS